MYYAENQWRAGSEDIGCHETKGVPSPTSAIAYINNANFVNTSCFDSTFSHSLWPT